VARYRSGEKVRMLHGAGFVPEVTMDYWKEVSQQGEILIIAAGSGAAAEDAAQSNIEKFGAWGIDMTYLPVFGRSCPEQIVNADILETVRNSHAIFFRGGLPGKNQGSIPPPPPPLFLLIPVPLRCLTASFSATLLPSSLTPGCLHGVSGLNDYGLEVPDGFSTEIIDLILEKQVVGGASAGLMAQPGGAYFLGTFPHDGATFIGEAQVPIGNMGLRTTQDFFMAHSHFSERGQQGPMLVALWQEGQHLGVGFDESLAGYYFEDSGDVFIVSDEDDDLRGVWIHEMVTGSEEGQEANVHMLVSGETWNARNNTRIRNPDHVDCSRTGVVPPSSESVFSFENNPIREMSLQMATAPVGSSLRSTDTGPNGDYVELVMTVTEQTQAPIPSSLLLVSLSSLFHLFLGRKSISPFFPLPSIPSHYFLPTPPYSMLVARFCAGTSEILFFPKSRSFRNPSNPQPATSLPS
jgi:hypothetical protein